MMNKKSKARSHIDCFRAEDLGFSFFYLLLLVIIQKTYFRK